MLSSSPSPSQWDWRHAKLVGLLSFAWLAIWGRDEEQRAMATVILVNGILCHSTGHGCLVLWDVAVNLLLIGYVNARTTWQPQTALLTACALVSFALSHPHPSSPWHCAAHVLLVQGGMAIALAQYNKKKEW